MKTTLRLMRIAAVCCVCSMVSHAQEGGGGDGPGNREEPAVTIELTRFEVSDSLLALDYRISNGSDHDIWVCSQPSSIPFEMYVAQDRQTLVIRKRLDVPTTAIWRRPPSPATYIRLRPGDEQAESLLIDLPATQTTIYASRGTQAALTVRRLAVEVGFYDEDLPALVHSIFDAVDGFVGPGLDLDPNIYKTYFRGFAVRGALSSFNVGNKDPYGDGRVYVDYSYQALTGEKVLRVEIDGVSILCHGFKDATVSEDLPSNSQ